MSTSDFDAASCSGRFGLFLNLAGSACQTGNLDEAAPAAILGAFAAQHETSAMRTKRFRDAQTAWICVSFAPILFDTAIVAGALQGRRLPGGT